MRIVYTCQHICIHGGLERIIVEKANAMVQAGHDVCLIVNNPPGQKPAYDIDPAIQLYDIALPAPKSILGSVQFKVKQNLRVRRVMRQFHPDIVVVVPTWLTLSMLFAPGRLVMESHSSRDYMFSSEKRQSYKRLKVALAERRAACVVTLTQTAAAQWPRAKKVTSIPNFTEIKPFSAYDADSRHIIAAARISPEKGFDLLTDAWSIVIRKHPDWHLDIYGDCPSGSNALQCLLNRINKDDLRQNVHYKGVCRDMSQAYAGHSIYALSSRYEGFGLVLIEAMTCGLPCVSFDCPDGPHEIINNGCDGFLVPYCGLTDAGRSAAFAEALCSMIEDRNMRTRMSKEAILKAGNFSRNIIMNQWLMLFNTLTEK